MKLFISYAHKDATELAKKLLADLTAAGHELWLDLEGLSAGKSWAEGIEEAIRSCDATLALLSYASYVSEICRAEQTLSIDLKKPVYPLLVQSDAPRPLTLYIRQYLDFSETRLYVDRLDALKTALLNPKADDVDFRVTPKPRTVINTAPQLPPNFIPRPDVLERLRAAVMGDETDRQIALTAVSGMGGIGKSVLAAALSRDPVVQAAFPDGIVWVSIGREPKSLVEQVKLIGTTLQDLGGDYSSEESALARLRAMLPEKAALIVLDDVWDVKHVEPYRLDAPRCRTLITTRSASVGNAAGATGVSLDVMRKNEALNLLKEWSGSAILPSEADAVAKECGNLPLALAMAGAMIRNGTSWSNILKKLQNAKLDRISEKLPGYDHSDLLRTLQVSVDDLDSVRGLGDLKARYFDLAIFREEAAVPLATLAKYWEPLGLDEDDTEDVVTALANRSLIRIQNEVMDKEQTRRASSLQPTETGDSQKLVSLHDLQLDYIRASVSDAQSLHDRLLKGYNPAGRAWHSAADGYLFPNLVYHLRGAGRESELPTLFANDQWMIDRFNHDGYTYTGFIEDLMTAWDVADAIARTQLAPEQEPMALADCIRYALIRTSINSLASNHVPELVARAVATELWSLTRALALAANTSDQQTKIRLYTLLLHETKITESDRTRIGALGLEAGLSLSDEYQRTKALEGLAGYLNGNQQMLVLEHTLACVRTIRDEHRRAEALESLAEHLHLSRNLLDSGLEVALGIKDEALRAEALGHLADHLDGELLDRALAAALMISSIEIRAGALVHLSKNLDKKRKDDICNTAQKIILKIKDKGFRVLALGELAEQLSGDRREEVLKIALKTAISMNDQLNRSIALSILSAKLSSELKEKALESALSIKNDLRRAVMLSAVIGNLHDDLLERALEATLAINDEGTRARVLANLTGQLSGRLLERALTATLAIKDEGTRTIVLRSLAGRLSGDLLERAVDAAVAISYEGTRADVLRSLAEQLSGNLLDRTLNATFAIRNGQFRADVLRSLANQMSGESLERALDVGLAIKDEEAHARALAVLTRQTGGGKHSLSVKYALMAALSIVVEEYREYALSSLAEQLDGELLEVAIKDVLDMSNEGRRVSLLGILAQNLNENRREAILELALDSALSIDDEKERAFTLETLVPKLTGRLLNRANEAVLAIEDEELRTFALWKQTGEITDEMLERWLENSLWVADEQVRADSLETLVTRLTGEWKDRFLERWLRAVLVIRDTAQRAYALGRLVPYLSGTLLDDGFEAIISIEDQYIRASVLIKLPSQLNPTTCERIFSEAHLFSEPYYRLKISVPLVGNISDIRLIPFIRTALVDGLLGLQGRKRETILWLLNNEEKPFPSPVMPIFLLERIADDIIDVCWNWRWQ